MSDKDVYGLVEKFDFVRHEQSDVERAQVRLISKEIRGILNAKGLRYGHVVWMLRLRGYQVISPKNYAVDRWLVAAVHLGYGDVETAKELLRLIKKVLEAG